MGKKNPFISLCIFHGQLKCGSESIFFFLSMKVIKSYSFSNTQGHVARPLLYLQYACALCLYSMQYQCVGPVD